jgi:hypothetical protein
MATYKGIQGFTIQNLSADPSNPIEGEMWYNSTSNVWKVEEATTAGTWASAPSLNSDHNYSQGVGATTSDGQLAGGAPGGSTANELWNGTTWTTSTNFPAAYRAWGASTQGSSTASFYVGGITGPITGSNQTTDWDDSTLTSSGDYPLNTWDIRAAGTQTTGLAVGGIDASVPSATNVTNLYNGASWTSAPNWPISKRNHIAFGTQTATLAGTGEGPRVDTFASFNGSTWASEANYPTILQGGTGSGVESAGIVAGGYGATADLATTNTYDGTTWTAQGNLGTARASLSSIGSVSGAKAMSGVGSPTGVEDYTGPGALVTKTITVS